MKVWTKSGKELRKMLQALWKPFSISRGRLRFKMVCNLWTTLQMFCTWNFMFFTFLVTQTISRKLLWNHVPDMSSKDVFTHGILWSRAMKTLISKENLNQNEIMCTKWIESCPQLVPSIRFAYRPLLFTRFETYAVTSLFTLCPIVFIKLSLIIFIITIVTAS